MTNIEKLCKSCGTEIKNVNGTMLCYGCARRRSAREKGLSTKYDTIHVWIRSNFGKANHCDICNATEILEGKKTWFEWSCRNGTPDYDLQNWWQLCRPCHRRYDIYYLGQKVILNCKVDGCKRSHVAKGLCGTHYARKNVYRIPLTCDCKPRCRCNARALEIVKPDSL